MRVHHLNCGAMRPMGGPVLGCHCLLVETGQGLVLVDTGFGTEDMERPRPRLSRFFIRLARIRFAPLDTAVEQVRELGFRSKDVRHIVLTHLDFDHAGGITDFPGATVHLLADEAAAARHRRGFIARRRYRPPQWRAVAKWQEYPQTGEDWFGFAAVRPLNGLPPEILLVPLPGHSAGHCGVAVQAGDRWLLHAGDAYFNRAEMNPRRPHCPAGLAAYQRLLDTNRDARRRNQQRLRDLVARAHDRVTVFCAHDVNELEAQQRRVEQEMRAEARSDQARREGANGSTA